MHLEDVAAQQLSATFKVQWQCELENAGHWADYHASQQKKIETAWQAMAHEVEVGTVDWPDTWLIDFVALVQINQQTGRRRRVRRVLISHQ